MSEDKTDDTPPVDDESRGDTAKAASPPPETKQKPETNSGPATKNNKDRPRRKRGIMRSFFSHIIVAALAVAGVGGYFHWEDILSQTGGRVCAYEVLGKYGSSEPGANLLATSAAEASTSTKAVEPQAPEKTPEAPTPVEEPSDAVQSKQVVPASTPDAEKTETQTTDMKADENPAVTEDAAPSATTGKAEKAEAKKVAPKSDAPMTAEPANDVEKPKSAEASKPDETAEPKVATNDAPKVAIVSSSGKKTFETEWADARRAYWAGDDGAEKAYLELIAQYPDQADIKGELGNIYVKAGANEKAASQFLDAGMIWVKSGEKDKATKLVSLLEKLSPEKATSLKEALANAG